jgi:hypothetical protein
MKKPMPFDFLLDYLPASVVIKPAIGMFYIYFEGKIMPASRQLFLQLPILCLAQMKCLNPTGCN